MELEVLAMKMDRFGWARDRGTAVQDRIIRDWIDALVDYPLDEVQAACRAAVMENPGKMPNEGHVHAQIMAARRRKLAATMKPPEPPVARELVSRERAAEILEERGFAPKRMGDT